MEFSTTPKLHKWEGGGGSASYGALFHKGIWASPLDDFLKGLIRSVRIQWNPEGFPLGFNGILEDFLKDLMNSLRI